MTEKVPEMSVFRPEKGSIRESKAIKTFPDGQKTIRPDFYVDRDPIKAEIALF